MVTMALFLYMVGYADLSPNVRMIGEIIGPSLQFVLELAQLKSLGLSGLKRMYFSYSLKFFTDFLYPILVIYYYKEFN